MGDVVGALPLYLPKNGYEASVIIPKYKRKWFADRAFETVHESTFQMGAREVAFSIQKLTSEDIGFPFYCVDLPGLFDREDIYLAENGHGYPDEPERNIAFQTAILEWLSAKPMDFVGLHCHDHMTGLITFFIKHCPKYSALADTPTFLTIHNGQYRGNFHWSVAALFPSYETEYNGLLDWDGQINSLATAIKCAWKVNTVSPSYMKELARDSDTLTSLYDAEKAKLTGILNGIDNDLWNPATDEFLEAHLEGSKWTAFKNDSKKVLIDKYELKGKGPLIGFIGRLAYQKGADLLAKAIAQCISANLEFNVVILGSGDKAIEEELSQLAAKYPDNIGVTIAYNEGLARKIYAGCDYLIMPSRFEPCGLNQMNAMRYGTIPVVSWVGGLKDTVPDITDNGNGIVFDRTTADDISVAIDRAVQLYKNKAALNKLRRKIVKLDFSWNQSAARKRLK